MILLAFELCIGLSTRFRFQSQAIQAALRTPATATPAAFRANARDDAQSDAGDDIRPTVQIDQPIVAVIHPLFGLHHLAVAQESGHHVVADVQRRDVAARIEGDTFPPAERLSLDDNRRAAIRCGALHPPRVTLLSAALGAVDGSATSMSRDDSPH